MKTCNLFYTLMALPAMLFTACQSDDDTLQAPVDNPQKEIRVRMNVGRATYDDEGGTRAVSSTWNNGDCVFLRFHIGDSLSTYGYVTYDAATDSWIPQLKGSLPTTAQPMLCQAYFFGEKGNSSTVNIRLTSLDPVYGDPYGSYTYADGELSITATVSPLTGRLRMKGNRAEEYYIYGLRRFTRFNLVTGTFDTVDERISGITDSVGYSPYHHVMFSNSMRKLVFDDHSQNKSYGRFMGSNVLAKGHSGFLNIPNRDSSSGWTVEPNFVDVPVGDITFRMVKVMSGTFQMGYVNSDYNVSGYHQVTLTKDYYIGETEVTQELWNAVMGSSNNPSSHVGDKYPVESVTWDNAQTFITNLNAMVSDHTFRLPTEAEWEFAARGGCISEGYVYSGSNEIYNVAWYPKNCGGTTHEVQTLNANELGIYDMSGNVSEWCADVYEDYSDRAQTDPIGASSNDTYRVHRGGNYYFGWGDPSHPQFNVIDWRLANRSYEYNGGRYSYLGFRLASQ